MERLQIVGYLGTDAENAKDDEFPGGAQKYTPGLLPYTPINSYTPTNLYTSHTSVHSYTNSYTPINSYPNIFISKETEIMYYTRYIKFLRESGRITYVK
jgi:hypothetical protein